MSKLSIIILLCILICTSFNASAKKRRKDLQMGGRIAYTMPNNWGKATSIGFKDVAAKGVQFAYFGRWFYAKRLSLGWDLAYQTQKGSEFWDVDNYGEVSASYQTIQLLAEGNYLFSHDEVRPYIGVAFGGFWLRNHVNFSANSINNNSVVYTADNIMPGVAPQVGIAIELSEKTMLDIHARLILIPNLEEEYIQDPEIGLITLNPHGAQNHLSLSLGLLFNL
ncbi:hypothetical protein [Carboxylicivirga sp. N1Y90]|uniref:hypothetical protein n=1 Tax=Carboxylicivirga fragile TaxID=3417571 RepID=UPI003D32AB9F|nr:hypothetical protein [Marinilabiliaceae bacterium N1Y90]